MTKRLRHGGEEGLRGVTDLLVLPVWESVGQDQFDAAVDDTIHAAVSPAVPAVGSTDLGVGESRLHVLDLGEKLLGGEVATVEGLRSNGDGVERVLVARDVLLESRLVGIVGLVGVGPGLKC